MSGKQRCPRCNASLSDHQATAGECPACLLRLAVTSSEELAPGTQVGLYRIVREIGEGGMGLVYLAEQETPIRRQVALKVIKRGMDTRQVVARFEAEQQALALMDHPCVARVHEAGETDDGRPFFVMEYIEGEAITDYCDRRRMDTRGRLELCGKVCEGVQHAHRRGIIHRDIKPSNVLVAEEDGVALPKIIDFGVAKAIDQRLSQRSLFTEFGVLLGTPEYMSPEQADLDPNLVDTRTDVYSLGVLLYELLTGALPFDSGELRSAAFDEIRRQIREELPALPSTRIRSLDSASQTAARRRTDPTSLSREVTGDLDAITMKALEKEPSRRYESPSELLADIDRHLRNEPVLARPPSSLYQLRKWVSRNRVTAALSGLLLLSLIGFSVGMSVLFVRARSAETRAEREARAQRRVTDFMIRMFEVSDPNEARGNQTTARELLDEAAANIDVELRDDPAARAELSGSVGAVYRNLGLHASAEPLLRSAFVTLSEIEGPDSVSALRAERDLGALLQAQGEYDAAEQVLTRNETAFRRIHGAEHVETLESRRQLGNLRKAQGRYSEAEQILRTLLTISRRKFGDGSLQVVRLRNDLVRVLILDSQYDEAETLITEVVEAETRISGSDSPRTLAARFDLATLLRRRSRLDQAETAFSRLLDDQQRILGNTHPRTVETMNRLAGTYMNLNKDELAEKLYLQIIEIQRESGRGDDHIDTLLYVGNLANLYEQNRRLDEAEPLLVDTVERRRRMLGEEHPFTLGALNNLGNVYMGQKKLEEAERVFRQALDTLLRTLGEEHEDTLRTMSNLGLVLWNTERYDEAIAMLQRTIDAQRVVLGETSHQVGITGYNLAQMRQIRGDLEGAKKQFEENQYIRDTSLGKTNPDSLRNMNKHIALLREIGDDTAADLLEDELAMRETALEAERALPTPSTPKSGLR